MKRDDEAISIVRTKKRTPASNDVAFAFHNFFTRHHYNRHTMCRIIVMCMIALSIILWVGCTDTEPPSVEIISPEHGTRVGDTTSIIVEVEDNKNVYYVDIYIDDSVADRCYSDPFTYLWATDSLEHLSDHEIYAEVVDLSLNSAVSDAVTVTVVHPGTLKWKLDLEGITACPAIGDDGTIYVATTATFYDYSYLHAINPDGTYKWHCQLYSEGSVSVIGPDGTIYVSATAPNSIPYLAAISSNGAPIWDISVAIFGGPALGPDGAIYSGQQNGLYVYNTDGTLRWSYALPSRAFSPAIAADGTIYIGCYDGYVYALNPDTTLKWRYPVELQTSIAIGADGSIYCGTHGHLYALNSDGTLKWQYYTEYRIMDPVIGFGELVYTCAPSSGGFVYIALNANGKLVWSGSSISSVNPDCAVAVAADSTIYCASDALYALTTDHEIKWFCDDVNGASLPLTVSNDGTVYVVSDQRLYAVSGAAPLANTPWPKVRHDTGNTGRMGY